MEHHVQWPLLRSTTATQAEYLPYKVKRSAGQAHLDEGDLLEEVLHVLVCGLGLGRDNTHLYIACSSGGSSRSSSWSATTSSLPRDVNMQCVSLGLMCVLATSAEQTRHFPVGLVSFLILYSCSVVGLTDSAGGGTTRWIP